uniref:cGMP-dependent protein kinase n=1 Tax=Strongyloides stercoralis TaxID=6248 RepID=A0A0K0EQQ6_STRER
MNCFSICKLCSSNSNKLSMKSPKKKENNIESIDQVDNDSTYGVIDPQTSITIENNDSNKKLSSLNSPQPSKIINVSFRHKARKVLFGNDRLSQPAIIKENTKDSSKILNRKSLPLFSSKNKRELPKLPVPSINENNSSSNNDGKNLFITSKEIPFDEKANEVYETIYPETDSIVDPFYTKIINDNKNTQKYDYPIFNNNKCKKGNGKEKNQINEDPIYTSASQIYGGSDDAYSSILSNVGGDKENGYAKVTERKNSNDTDSNIPMVDEDLPSSSTVQNPVSINLDSLYAKIKRPTNKEKNKEKNCLETTSKDPIPSSITNDSNKLLQKVDNTTFDSLYQQLDESGSGSIISSYSQNPSYRYITVRETVDVVRERIRRHEEELSRERNNNVNNPGREHYYSTINEYESVGDGNISDNIYDITNSSSTTTNYMNSKNLNINNKLSTSNPTNKIRIIKPKIIPSTTYPSMKQVLLNNNYNNQSQIKTKCVSMAEIDTLHKNNSNIHTIDIKLTGRKFNENLLESNINLQKTFLSSFDLSWSNQLDNAITFISEILGKETPIENVFDDTFNIGYNIISSSIDKIKDLSDSMIMSKTNFIDNGCQTERISKIPKVLERKKSIDIGTQTYNIQKIFNINKNKLSKINKTISKDYVSTIDLSNERSWPLKKE